MRFLYFSFLAVLIFLSACSRPVANFTHSGDDKSALHAIEFTNASEKATEYKWNFGDGSSSEVENPTHRYMSSGEYKVTLEAMDGKKKRTKTQVVKIDPPKYCMVLIETPMGNMIARLSDATPLHRDNFLKLAEEGFYNDLQFHRVINGFMIQGGDPNSRNAKPGASLGSGGPGYTVPAEFVDSLVHVKGALSAARLGDGANPKKASSGSQFYIVQGRPVDEKSLERTAAMKGFNYEQAAREAYTEHGGTPFLDREYTVFGQVVEGLDVIDKIANTPTAAGDAPKEPVTMKISIIQ